MMAVIVYRFEMIVVRYIFINFQISESSVACASIIIYCRGNASFEHHANFMVFVLIHQNRRVNLGMARRYMND